MPPMTQQNPPYAPYDSAKFTLCPPLPLCPPMTQKNPPYAPMTQQNSPYAPHAPSTTAN